MPVMLRRYGAIQMVFVLLLLFFFIITIIIITTAECPAAFGRVTTNDNAVGHSVYVCLSVRMSQSCTAVT